MDNRKKIDKSSHYRVLLTDTLPYETPLFFSNERLYFALKSGLTGIPTHVTKALEHRDASKPFSYEINKGSGGTRVISIPHPGSQIQIANLYKDFDGFVENLCSKSKFSLRYPSRKGSTFYQSQFSMEEPEETAPDLDPLSFDEQRTWGSSYFSYLRYNQMYKFFSSREFLHLEQRFSILVQVDVSRCFESIYTHSIAWSVRGKEFSKSLDRSYVFEAKFDQAMRNSNWGETNGIIIGPEFSRIFAEIILQSCDLKIESDINSENLDVEVRRYLDDFLIFGNDERSTSRCKEIIEARLHEINLHLNESKTKTTLRPLSSSLTIARSEAHHELKNFFQLCKDAISEPPGHFPSNASSTCIQNIRDTARRYGVTYSSLASPALAVVARNILRIRKRCESNSDSAPPKHAALVIHEIINVAHFLFSVDIRMATSHKVAKIYYEAASLASKLGVNRKSLRGQFIAGMRMALAQSKNMKISGPEMINLLIAVESCYGNSRAISTDDVARSLRVESWPKDVKRLNYFDLMSLLFFARKKAVFATARELVIQEIEERLDRIGHEIHNRAEESLLYVDYLACPHIDIDRRANFFRQHSKKAFGTSINVQTAKESVLKIQKRLGFINWNGTRNLHGLLAKKELQPAYE